MGRTYSCLTSGKIDAIIAGMSPTEERLKQIDFSKPYYHAKMVMVTQKDSKYASAKSINDFEGQKSLPNLVLSMWI